MPSGFNFCNYLFKKVLWFSCGLRFDVICVILTLFGWGYVTFLECHPDAIDRIGLG